MRVIIDGENLRHQLSRILIEAGALENSAKNDYFPFNMRDFLANILASNNTSHICYYTTRVKQPTYKIPQQLSEKLDKISTSHRKWIAKLSSQNITVIKAGHLKIRESNACVHCGKKTLVLQEKGVDVRIATDLLQAAKEHQPIVLVSSDSDLVPSLQTARKLGAKVTYVCPADRVNRALVANTDKVITFDSDKVLTYFRNTHDKA